jgi:outer membrane protein TolC
MVEQNHPMAKRAGLENDKAAATLLAAKGAFDPMAYGSTYWKQLDDKQYFRQWEAGLTAPLWPGIKVEAGYENNTGLFINPENSTVSNGLLFAGLSIPLLRGLTTDQRRIALQKARIDQVRAEAQEDVLVNDLLLRAAYAYWDWWLADQQLQIINAAIQLAYQRYQDIVRTYELGDLAAVDTLEAYIQWQNRKVDLQKADIQYLQTGFQLSNFMWTEDGEPLFLNPEVFPEALSTEIANERLAAIRQEAQNINISAHPLMKVLAADSSKLERDLRLQKEFLKPQLDLKYNWLFTPVQENNLSFRDYRWGVGMSIPLAYRGIRAGINNVKIRQQELNLSIDQRKLELSNSQQALSATADRLLDNIRLYTQLSQNYSRLLEAEQQKFNAGESSVFLINARENQFLQAVQNLNYLQFELQKNLYLWRWNIGVF